MMRTVCGLAIVLAQGLCLADTLTTRDGAVREGVVLEENDESVTFEIRTGNMKAALKVPRIEIVSLERKPFVVDRVLADGAELQKNAEGQQDKAVAIEAWLKVAEHFESHPGYFAQAKLAYEKILALDPDHNLARTRLGFGKDDKGWKRIEPKKVPPPPQRPKANEELVIEERPAPPVQPVPPARPVAPGKIAIGDKQGQTTDEDPKGNPQGTWYVGRDGVVYCPPDGTLIIDRNGVSVQAQEGTETANQITRGDHSGVQQQQLPPGTPQWLAP